MFLFLVSLEAGFSQVGPHAAATSALAFAERLFSQDRSHSDMEWCGLGKQKPGTGRWVERSHRLYSLYGKCQKFEDAWNAVDVKMISYWVTGLKFVTGSGGRPAWPWYPSKRFNKQILNDWTWKWHGSCTFSIVKLSYCRQSVPQMHSSSEGMALHLDVFISCICNGP